MRYNQFREFWQTAIQAVRLVMSSGQTYDIRHPETALLTRTSILRHWRADDGVLPNSKSVRCFMSLPLSLIEPAFCGVKAQRISVFFVQPAPFSEKIRQLGWSESIPPTQPKEVKLG